MKIDFEKFADGLVPAIAQDADTGRVLMLGYMSRKSFELTAKTGRATFFSRSRQKLWTKGETSGNFLTIREILADCDADAILLKVEPHGAICHTGAETCFNEANEPTDFLRELEKTIKDRQTSLPENSYTAQLFQKGINRIAQKVGEETIELIIEAKDDNRELFKAEAADLLYHWLVLLRAKNVDLSEIFEVLKQRK